MINLLSPHAKKKLWNMYRLRLAVIVLCALLSLQLLAALVFFPTFYTLRTTTNFLTAELEREKLRIPEKSEGVVKQITALRNELLLLDVGKKPSDILPSELLGNILRVKPKGIAITAVAYQKEKESVAVQLSGIASTRDDILSFKNTLSAEPNYVVRTNDYLTKKTDISFSITMTLK